MAYTIKIDKADYSQFLERKSLKHSTKKNGIADTLTFLLKDFVPDFAAVALPSAYLKLEGKKENGASSWGDQSGNSRDFTITGATAEDLGYSFDGNDQIEATAALDLTDGTVTKFTISASFVADSFAGNLNFFFRGLGNSLYPRMHYNVSGDELRLQYRIDGSTKTFTVTPSDFGIEAGEEFEILVRGNVATGVEWYINGELADSNSTTGTKFDSGTSKISIGYDSNISYYLTGECRYFAVFVNEYFTDAQKDYQRNWLAREGYLATSDTLLKKPVIDTEVHFLVDATTYFSGLVVDVDCSNEDKDSREYTIYCEDYSRLADKGEPIAEIYQDSDGDTIIADLLARYPQLADFTGNNVDCGIEFDYLLFNHLKFTEVLSEMAERIGFDFYIDKDKDVHFFDAGSESAPFSVDSTNGNALDNSINLKESGRKIVNWLLVQGGLYDATETSTESFVADGSQTEFELFDRYSNLVVEVQSVAQTVGTFGIHDAADYDVLYDYSGRRVVFRDDNKPASMDDVDITGNKKLPVLVQVSDVASIARHGTMPDRIQNYSLNTLASAKQFAIAELNKRSAQLNSGNFRTHTDGLRAGQKITVSNTALNKNNTYVIQSITGKLFSFDRMEYSVTLASAEELDALGKLKKLINDKKNLSSVEEFLNVFKIFAEEIQITENISLNQNQQTFAEILEITEGFLARDTVTTNWVHGEYAATSLSDANKPLLHDSTPCHT